MDGTESMAITRLLNAWQQEPDNRTLADSVAVQVYSALKSIAARHLRREQDPTLTPTELVHEAWLRMGTPANTFSNRAHFLRLAALTMRHLLVDLARERLAEKRGGDLLPVSLRFAENESVVTEPEILDLDRALSALEAAFPRQSEVVLMRSFAGMTIDEVADALAVSPATVKRDWEFGRAWLIAHMEGGDPNVGQ